MSSPTKDWQSIQEKIQELPGDKIEEIVDFINFVYRKEKMEHSSVNEESLRLQQESLARIWEDEEELYEL